MSFIDVLNTVTYYTVQHSKWNKFAMRQDLQAQKYSEVEA